MSLSPGTRVGPYEITAQIGAGGMGEVCRARDTKLNREVALKVLPAAFGTDPDRMARFQREAQLLAALNHPNIAAIYGLEDEGGVRAIVMELVEGHTLTGPVPVPDALPIAKQIAEALEYAHDRGIIHRDLKPANIKVTPEGMVKVLDFGLAKAMDEATDLALSLQGSMSPTLSLAATHAGVIMGTAGYMAPEQAKGKGADRRSDIWSFGIVLYELLTGSRMFEGDTVPETLASVMKDQVTLEKLPAETPSAIRKLLARCLEREPRRRLQSIGEARIVIEDVLTDKATEHDEERLPSSASTTARWAWSLAAIALLGAAGALTFVWTRPALVPPATMRFTIAPADGTQLTTLGPNAPHLAVSPDGRYVAYVADQSGRDRSLWIRALDSAVPQRVERSEGASFPFWSPDSQHIGYFASGKLMRVSAGGGAPLTICDAMAGEGGSWSQSANGEGVILFAARDTGPLFRVLARGGTPSPVTTIADGEVGHSFPQFLPDGRFFYWVRGKKSGIYVQSLASNERTFIVDAPGRALFSPPGFLLYLRDSTLLAHRWNLDSLALEGEPFTIAEDVRTGGGNGRNAFSVSWGGLLVYRGGAGLFRARWYSRDGAAGDVVVEGEGFGAINMSPDGRQVIIPRGRGSERDLWLMDLTTGVFSRLTSAAGTETQAVWSPDSRSVAYTHVDGSTRRWYQIAIGSGTHREIVGVTGQQSSIKDWIDGKLLFRSPTGFSIMPVPPDGGPGSGAIGLEAIHKVSYLVDQARVSPDGKWVAFMSMESGRAQIEIASFPSFNERRQVSIDPAVQPSWRADGRELFFLGLDQKLMAMDVETGATLRTGPIRTLFQTAVPTSGADYMFAATRDGQRFLVREPKIGQTREEFHVVTNWPSLAR
jgi:Tol biopolymer transport system component